jgi:hypothetical protein
MKNRIFFSVLNSLKKWCQIEPKLAVGTYFFFKEKQGVYDIARTHCTPYSDYTVM